MTNPTQQKQSSGQPVGGRWAQQQKKWVEKQEQGAKREQHEAQNETGGQQGDNRTPEKPIGPMAFADRDPAKKKTGEF